MPWAGSKTKTAWHFLASDSVSLVIVQCVLEEVPDIDAALSELGRVLGGDGTAFLEIPFNPHVEQSTSQPPNHFGDVWRFGADLPDIDVTFLDYPDPAMGEFGARGVGEIGLAGVAPAITAAVYHATGVRVRELPVRIEHLLQSKIVEA